jgi:serine/threonine-protein kinase RsbT
LFLSMSASRDDAETVEVPDPLSSGIADLRALVGRVVRAQVNDPEVAEDIVQETLTRLLAARERLDDRAIGPYAVVTARNLVRSHWRKADTGRRHEHRLVDGNGAADPQEVTVQNEETEAIRAALDRLSSNERQVLVAHEVTGRTTSALADEIGSTPGAVAARLNRSRAKLRVEYLLELHGDPPRPECRPVLLSLSGGDRRRQAELDAGYHLLDCDFCASVSETLLDRRAPSGGEEVSVNVERDASVVVARQRAREVASSAGFSLTEATVIATAVSEIARNIVRFARRGRITMMVVSEGDATGMTVIARDAGPGIHDVEEALREGMTTYGGLGLGLPGSRRLMDEFDVTSEVGRGTTVTMTKWRRR